MPDSATFPTACGQHQWIWPNQPLSQGLEGPGRDGDGQGVGEQEPEDSEVTTSPAARARWVCPCVCSLRQVTTSLGLRSFNFLRSLG